MELYREMKAVFCIAIVMIMAGEKADAQYGVVASVFDLPYWPPITLCKAYKLEYTTLYGKGNYTRSVKEGKTIRIAASYTSEKPGDSYTEQIDSLYEYTDADHYRIKTAYRIGEMKRTKTIEVERQPGVRTIYRYDDSTGAEECSEYYSGKERTDTCIVQHGQSIIVTHYNAEHLLRRKEWYKRDATGSMMLEESIQREYVRDEQQRIKTAREYHYLAIGQEYAFSYYYSYAPDKITIIRFTDGIPLKQEQLVLQKDNAGYLKSFTHTIITTREKKQNKITDCQGTFSCQ